MPSLKSAQYVSNASYKRSRAPAKYGIRRIDFDALVDLFFWDTYFFLPEDDVADVGMEARKQLAINPETFGLTQGLSGRCTPG